MRTIWLAAVLVLSLAASAQDPNKKQDPAQAHEKVDQKRVDEAIKKGVAFLRTQMGALKGHKGPNDRDLRYDELVLWTFVHAGVKEDDPDFQKLFKTMMETKLERTYLVSLQAMILEELDRVKYQWRLHQCAQFLADNQCANGQWSYGDQSIFVEDIPSQTGETKRKDTATGGGNGTTAPPKKEYDPSIPRHKREKPKVTKRIPVKKQREGPEGGDNSNTQYAALGLRACHDSGIVFEKELLAKAERWWRDSQKRTNKKDIDKLKENNGSATGPGSRPITGQPQGWCYGGEGHGHEAYGSMTAGAVGSLVIYMYMQGRNWKNDKDVLDGVVWLIARFTVKENPGPPEHGEGKTGWMYYYYLYALERAGILFGTETLGSHEWYPEGANVLLDAQQSNGSWVSKDAGHGIWDTCFAILFLRRATRPLEDVITGDKKR